MSDKKSRNLQSKIYNEGKALIEKGKTEAKKLGGKIKNHLNRKNEKSSLKEDSTSG